MTAVASIDQRRSSSSFWHAAWYRYRRNRPALVSGVVAVVILIVAAAAPLIAPYGYAAQDLTHTLAGPSWHHLLGTDQLGRDMLSRIIYGARTSMTIAVGAPLLGALIGLPVGIISGWFGGVSDFIALRAFEVFTMVPQILAALLLIALFGSGVWKLLLFLGITSWIGFGRLARAQYIGLRDRDFVQAARAMGVPQRRIVIVHILPNALGPIVVYFVQQIPATIFAAAGFSFLGLGVQDPLADWGKMINDGEQYLSLAPMVALLPIFCIALATLSFSFLGDGLRDALDPDLTVAAMTDLTNSTTPSAPTDTPDPMLEVRDLHVSFDLERSTVYAVQGLSLAVRAGERLGVVGESGSGKSISALSVMRMVPVPGRITDGEIIFEGRDLRALSEAGMRSIRGGQIGMIPQNPLTSLNPVLNIRAHFAEVLSLHLHLHGPAATDRTVELLHSVGIPDPATRMREYPHRLSGGQRQRVMIALAMACEPRLLIADEPTTALDVTIQAQILQLIDDLVAESNIGAVLITHNLGIVAGHCDRVVVMYAGRVMEAARVPDLFAHPAHPYTLGLLRCVPRLTATRSRRFHAIPGQPPLVTQLAAGCPFAPRCERASDRCRAETPPLTDLAPGHAIACWHPVTEPVEVAV